MRVAAVVPTIDEADTIGDLVRSLRKRCDAVCVTDASPSPATMQAAIEAGAFVRDVPRNGGLDAAYSIGNIWVPDDEMYVVHIDAGGSHDPIALYPMLDLADEGFDVVIGSRFVVGGEHHGPWRRRVTSRLAAAALNLISLQDISDWTSGYRVYSPTARAALAKHKFTTTGHAWQIEALWVCLQNGCRVVEHPIVYRASVSHLSSGRVREAAGLYWRLAAE